MERILVKATSMRKNMGNHLLLVRSVTTPFHCPATPGAGTYTPLVEDPNAGAGLMLPDPPGALFVVEGWGRWSKEV